MNYNQLPAPPYGRSGWPWTGTSPPGFYLPHGRPWPRITVVTPSLNQGCFLEETIRSVLLQHYPNLEYIIIDGGSTDDSKAIIEKYAPWLAYWVSEPDNGQSHAINKGLKKGTGDILTWICSSDSYLPGAFYTVGDVFMKRPIVGAISGSCYVIDKRGHIIGNFFCEGFGLNHRLLNPHIPQPATFLTSALMNQVGLLDEKLFYVMDYELWLRILRDSYFLQIPDVIANVREHDNSKSMHYAPESLSEKAAVLAQFFSEQGLQLNHVRKEFTKILLGYASRCLERDDYTSAKKLFKSAYLIGPKGVLLSGRNIRTLIKLLLGAQNVSTLLTMRKHLNRKELK